jgi:hypothetical protein
MLFLARANPYARSDDPALTYRNRTVLTLPPAVNVPPLRV